jgi:U4/U6.U5 tri-snRNP-associated protein 2
LAKHGREDISQNVVEKAELVEITIDFVTKSLPDMLAAKYDLIANITHDSPAEVGREGQHDPLQEGSYKCHVQHQATRQWYEMQGKHISRWQRYCLFSSQIENVKFLTIVLVWMKDLHVQETMPQLIGLSESYVLIFERKGMQSQ